MNDSYSVEDSVHIVTKIRGKVVQDRTISGAQVISESCTVLNVFAMILPAFVAYSTHINRLLEISEQDLMEATGRKLEKHPMDDVMALVREANSHLEIIDKELRLYHGLMNKSIGLKENEMMEHQITLNLKERKQQ